MMCWVFVVFAVASCLSPGVGMTPYGAGGGASVSEGAEDGSIPTRPPQGSGTFLGAGSQTGTLGSSGPASFNGFLSVGRPADSTGDSFAASGDTGFLSAGRRPGSSDRSFPASGASGFLSAGRPTVSRGGFFPASGDNVFPSFDGPSAQHRSFPDGSAFTRSVILGQPTLTVTQTVTRDAFTTLTDTVFNTFAVTQTQFVLQTTTRLINQVVATPVDDYYTIRTTIVERPTFVTVTETKSDFRLFLRTSVTHITLTHTSYAITHVPFTITATETVHITSPMVKTVITTQRQLVTDYRTLVNTIYVHGSYL